MIDLRLLGRTDLNLLVALQALLEERNVTKAATRLNVTQSAMSKTLYRLRELFGDPLFTRSGTAGMIPTPRALAIQAQLAKNLHSLNDLLHQSPFEPATFQGEFTVSTSDIVGAYLFAPLFARLKEQAPGISIVAIPEREDQHQQVINGTVDFWISIQSSNVAQEIRHAKKCVVECLGRKRQRLWARSDHPVFTYKGQLTWDRVRNFPQVRLYNFSSHYRSSSFPIPQLRAWSGEPAHFDTPYLLTALQVLKRTSAVMMGALVLTDSAAFSGISSRSVIVGSPYAQFFECLIINHHRVVESPPHQWLRSQIVTVLTNAELLRAVQHV